MPWFYYGAGEPETNTASAHGFYDEAMRRVRGSGLPSRFDGLLAPQPERADELYTVAISRLGGLRMTAASWWDRSRDARPGSNSIIFAPGLIIEPTALLDGARERFPWVFARLPRPLILAAHSSVVRP